MEKKLTIMISEKLHTKFKILAIQRKASMKELILGFIEREVRKQKNI
ncbi:MAG: hypothetical protein HOK24_14375 [Desulfobacula sp.]|jgi:predicted HicB family RNase H-like nuclease|nr:hypothetical protein [Desulfobacula sp.]MBT5545644.1 hypothetical protein [Desulfobacula sp.]MBT6750533.1 hypothetical protein [Desulfobacula sp.]MBT7051024.1 hypothetical protein [Desulfobacula sp.]MBT7632038.1 hypothetical protein [Desulfobacula sp.]